MASKVLQIVGKFGRQLIKFRGFRFQPHKPDVPAVSIKPVKHLLQAVQPKKTIWEIGRYLFKTPQLFRRGPFGPIRLGLCIGLAISNNDSVEFREIRDVANTCLQSSICQEKCKWEFSSLRQLETGQFLQKGCQGAIYSARPNNFSSNYDFGESLVSNEYPWVLKMLFNYREEDRPAGSQLDEEIVDTFKAETVPLAYLPPHPSIAKIHGAVVEKVPELPEAQSQFPCALPPSLYPDIQDFCFGEERTLFLVMKRYSSSLSEKIKEGALTKEQTVQILLQLLEGDVFMKKYGIAHRDLHAKNILVDQLDDGFLKACITDFGCATDKLTRKSPQCLNLETQPGIPSLQAPEVTNIDNFSAIDYRKADLWTIATLVYEMLHPGSNPFTKRGGLDSRFYSNSEIPTVPGAPLWLDVLVHEMLRNNPNERPSSEFCANIVHIMLMQMPVSWVIGEEPTTEQFRDWINLKLVGLIMNHRKSHIDLFHLIFCKRLTEEEFRKCLRWLRHNLC